MNKKDRQIRKLLKKETIQMPEQMSEHFDDTITHIRENAKRKPDFLSIGIRTAAVFALLAFIIMPNVSPKIALAMQDIPLIGSFINVITIYDYQTNNEYHSKSVKVPAVKADGDLKEPADFLNADIRQLTDTIISNFKKDEEEFPDSHFDLTIDYETVTNTDKWFTLKIMTIEAAGSSGSTYYYYHIDKEKGKIVTLSDLFDENFDYVSIFSKNIRKQMAKRMKRDDSLTYWIYPDEDINPNQNFYFKKNGDLVIVFGKYEVSPGYMGHPEFTIPKELFSDNLK